MGPFSEEKQYQRADSIRRLLDTNPQLDDVTKAMWETKLKTLCYDEDTYNERVKQIFSKVKRTNHIFSV